MKESLTFLREFARNPAAVGAVAPSSPGLVQAMVDGFDWESLRGVVELGPGTGVFTAAIVQRLHPEARFFALERSGDMAAMTRRRCPQAQVFEASASELPRYCDECGIDRIDAVICGLPWASFPETLQDEILEAMLGRLSDGGRFATFAYLQGLLLPAGNRFARKLKRHFREVGHSPTVWRNLPPAFVYRCVK